MLNKLMNSFIEHTESNNTDETVSVKLYSDLDLLNVLIQAIQSDDELGMIEILSVQYKNVLNIIYNQDKKYDEQTSHNMKILFLSPLFIKCFRKAIEGKEYDENEILYINKIGYDFIVSDINKNNKEVQDEIASLCSLVNYKMRTQLRATTCLQPEVIDVLLLSRYSHDNPDIYIRRLNLAIMNEGIVEEQEIVSVYENICRDFKSLFKITMIDVYTDEELNNIGSYADEAYSVIGLSVIDILSSLATPDIRQVLIDYHYAITTPEVQQTGVRFSMWSLSPDDYGNVLGVMEALKIEGIYL